MSVETALYTVLAAAIDDAEEDDALFESELHATLYERITKPFGVRIGDADFDLSPAPGGPIEEFDILGMIQIYARADSEDPEQLTAAREKVRLMAIAVAQVLFDDVTLGGMVHDSRILGGTRGWANVQTVRHAVAELHLIANETGVVEG